MFYKIVLKCVHLCIDGLHVGRLLLRDLLLFLQHCVSLLLSYLQIHGPIIQTCLGKLPSHIGIVITEDQIHFSDISNLIVWSFCVGIRHVSIYDSTGKFMLHCISVISWFLHTGLAVVLMFFHIISSWIFRLFFSVYVWIFELNLLDLVCYNESTVSHCYQ